MGLHRDPDTRWFKSTPQGEIPLEWCVICEGCGLHSKKEATAGEASDTAREHGFRVVFKLTSQPGRWLCSTCNIK